jgi:streptomycin 6-kinase
VLLHQDLHGGNVRRSARGWLAIDPKPLVGERAFDVASLLRDRRDDLARDPDAAWRIRRRLDFYSDRLGLDRERVRGWGIAHALAWGFEGGRPLAGHIECARLLMG